MTKTTKQPARPSITSPKEPTMQKPRPKFRLATVSLPIQISPVRFSRLRPVSRPATETPSIGTDNPTDDE